MKLVAVHQYLLNLQQSICDALHGLDKKLEIRKDEWRSEIGRGASCIMHGDIFEKAGVNFSSISASKLPPAATTKRPELAGHAFEAMGVSVVVHPQNPYVPTAHMNVRFFLAHGESEQSDSWWFGGGFDLTPYYGFVEDARDWHRLAAEACAGYGEDTYQRYKKWCDEYFYLPHRQENRGIGGLFFDDLNEWGFETCFEFIQGVSTAFHKAYIPIVEKRYRHPYSERERQFQLYRRGRYVEFNLIYDRGTLFGLQSNGRTESILMSLPPMARWEYDWKPESGSEESKLYEIFLKPRDWLNTDV